MIDLLEINETIDELKRNGSTVGAAEKLALLYIAREHMEREEQGAVPERHMKSGYSQAAAPLPVIIKVEPRSKFLEVCDGAEIEKVLKVIDEHMEAIMVLYPKEYEQIIKRIKESKRA